MQREDPNSSDSMAVVQSWKGIYSFYKLFITCKILKQSSKSSKATQFCQVPAPCHTSRIVSVSVLVTLPQRQPLWFEILMSKGFKGSFGRATVKPKLRGIPYPKHLWNFTVVLLRDFWSLQSRSFTVIRWKMLFISAESWLISVAHKSISVRR